MGDSMEEVVEMREVVGIKDNAIAVDSVVDTIKTSLVHLSHLELRKMISYSRFIRIESTRSSSSIHKENCATMSPHVYTMYVLCSYPDASKLISYGIETTYEYPEAPDLEDDPGKLKAHI
jgi:hypothetical protein